MESLKYKKYFILQLAFAVLPFTTLAQVVYNAVKNTCPPLVGKYVYVYEDKTNALDITDILKPNVLNQFKLSNQDVINYNITKSSIWCKLKITTQTQADWLLENKNGSVKKVEFYSFNNNIPLLSEHSGIETELAQRKSLGGHILFNLKLNPGDTIDVFLKVEDVAPLVIPVRIADVSSFFEEDHKFNLYHGMYFGIMLLMVFYNLFLYFTNKTKVYVYYILYIISSALFIAFFLGYVSLLPEAVLYLFKRVPVTVPACFGFFGLLFTMEFLNTAKYAPKVHKVMKVFIGLVTLPIISAILGYPHESILAIQVFGIVLAILSFASGISVLRKGYRPAKFYVIGFGAYMLGLVMLILTNAFQLSIGGLENYTLEIGSAIEAIMLSFAIGDKLNIAILEKQEAMQENEKLIREQNIVLERKVKERTQQLQEQKDIVEEKNKEITDSIKYAKRIQTALLPSDKYFEKHFNDLKKDKN